MLIKQNLDIPVRDVKKDGKKVHLSAAVCLQMTDPEYVTREMIDIWSEGPAN